MQHGNNATEKLQKASNALKYEIDMFRSLAEYFISGKVATDIVERALLESFLIHVRVLTDFFYPERCHKKVDQKKHNDIMAKNFFELPDRWSKIRPPKSDSLNEAETRANKLLAHLTYTRLTTNQEESRWKPEKIANELEKVLDIFLQNVPREFLGPKWETNSESKANNNSKYTHPE
jgi:hypothetical protein